MLLPVSLPVVVVPLLFILVAPLLFVPPLMVEPAFVVSILPPLLVVGVTITTVSFCIAFLVPLSLQLSRHKINAAQKRFLFILLCFNHTALQ